MAKKKSHSEDQRSLTEKLIEEAALDQDFEVTVVEEPAQDVADARSPTEVVESEKNRTTGPIARIDLQKFVEKEAYLRLAADFENFRKRALRERQESERNGSEKVLRGFLEIFDNLERGIKQAEKENSPLLSGLQMILSQIEVWLKAMGLERIESKGQIFDPSIHEAVTQVENPEFANGTVIEEVRRGYRWPDRLLRAAAVVVCKNPEEGE